MRIVVLGAGAVGGWFGGRLAAAGEDVVLLARGPHLAALRRDGLVVEGAGAFRTAVRAEERAADAGPADVLLVAVKTYDTEAAAEPCRPLLGPGSFAVSLQNGIGNEERLARVFGADRVAGGVAYVATEVVAPGRIACDAPGRLVLGEPRGPVSPRLRALAAAFERSGVRCELTDDLPRAAWEKMVANAVFNVIAAALGVELGDILGPPLRPLAEKAVAELVEVARARGIAIRPRVIDDCWEFLRRHPAFQTSTQQDLARGRGTEWRTLSGALIEEAARAGLAVPTHEMLAAKLREREAGATNRPRA